MRPGAEALLGALFLLALAVALPVGLQLAGGARDLRVTVRSLEPYELAPLPGASLALAVPGPSSLLPRLEARGEPDRADPGLWLRTWQLTYGHRWERQVTLPVLAGPFDPEGKPWPCAVAVRLSPRFFDDGKEGGGDLAAVLDRVVRLQFPFDVLGLHFASVARTQISVRPEEGGLHVSAVIVLADGARSPTELSLDARIALGERGGDLTAKLEHVGLVWRGRTRHDPMVELASMFMDVDAQARGVLSEKLAGALSILRLPRDPVALFEDRPRDRFLLRLCDAPESHPDGLTVRLRVLATLAEPRVEPAVPGPPHLADRPALGPAAPNAPTFEAAVSQAAVQQALYASWQAGELTAWARQPRVLAALRAKLEDRLAFELGAVDVRLPPVVLPEGGDGALRVRFGDLEIGHLGERRVAVHGDVLATARVEGGTLGLHGTFAELRVDCVDGAPGAWRLSPCFSDVVPVLRDNGLNSEGLPLDLAIPDRLLRLNLVLGTDLVLTGLTGEVGGTPPALRLRGQAALVRRAKDR